MKDKLLHNWGWKLVSLVLAFLLWSLVIQFEDPMDGTSFNSIPVRLINTELLEKQNKVYEVLDNTDMVRVYVKAPASIVKQMRASDIIAEADISKITDINTVGITYEVLNADRKAIEISGNHDVVRLNVEDRANKWLKLRYNTIGEPSEGYIVVGSSPDQTMIEITGPKSAVEQVDYANVEIDVTDATANLAANVEVKLYDKSGQVIENNSIVRNVNYVHMTAEILATKEVPIEWNMMGVPAEGFMATGVVESVPASVRIAGSSTLLAGINSISIPEEELNISGANSDLAVTVNLKDYLPQDVKLIHGGSSMRVTATAHIEPRVVRELVVPETNISVIGIPDGYTAVMVDDSQDCILEVSGLGALVNPLRQNLLRGSVDIKDWMEEQENSELKAGTYEIPVKFRLEEGITIEKVTAVKVIIAEEAE